MNGVGDGLRKTVAIDRQRRTGGDAMRIGRSQDQRTETPHFFFEQTYGVIELVTTKRVRADELRQAIGLVNGGRTNRPHLVQHDLNTKRSSLPGRFAPSETSAD